MSRRQGRRQRPAPERRAFVERYSGESKRRRITEGSRWKAPIGGGRRWTAVLAGTVVSIMVFSLLANAIVEAGDGNDRAAIMSAVGAALGVAVLLLVVGFVSRARAPWRDGALWAVAAVGLFVAAAYAAREAATAYVLALGVAVAWVTRFEESTHVRSWRMWAAVGLAVYTKAVYLFSPGLAIVAAPLLPLVGIAIIDTVAERRLRPDSSAPDPRPAP